MRPLFFGSGQRYMNKYLVETVSVLELLRSGLRSQVRGSILAYSSFEPANPDGRTTFDPPAASTRSRGGYASGADPRLVRTTAALVPGTGTQTIETCPA